MPPRRGQTVSIVIETLAGDSGPITGQVVHEEWSDGFGVRFAPFDEAGRKTFDVLVTHLQAIRRLA